jgi:phage terminase large subunit
MDLTFRARRQFKPYMERKQRYAIMVAHRRAGKTVATVQDLIIRALMLRLQEGWGPGRYAYVAPLYSQAKEIAWDYLRRFAEPVMVDANVAELHVTLRNGSRIRLHGADNPDRLRGGYLDGCVLDEYADMRPSVLGQVIRPMLADRQGWLTAIGTPKGRNDFHRLWDGAQTDPRWFSAMLRASQTGLILPEELADAGKDMTEEEYAQEFECSFDAAIKGAYFGKEIAALERAGHIVSLPVVKSLPVQTAWDIGVHDSTVVWVFQTLGHEIHVLDCIEGSNRGAPWYLDELDKRGWMTPETRHWLPHDVAQREWTSGRSRIEFLASMGLKIDRVPDISKHDGISAVRLMLPQTWFNAETCGDGIEALRQYRTEYNEKTKAFTDQPRHDWTSHFADAFRYLCVAARSLAPIKRDEPKPIGVSLDRLTFDEFHDLTDHHERRDRV